MLGLGQKSTYENLLYSDIERKIKQEIGVQYLHHVSTALDIFATKNIHSKEETYAYLGKMNEEKQNKYILMTLEDDILFTLPPVEAKRLYNNGSQRKYHLVFFEKSALLHHTTTDAFKHYPSSDLCEIFTLGYVHIQAAYEQRNGGGDQGGGNDTTHNPGYDIWKALKRKGWSWLTGETQHSLLQQLTHDEYPTLGLHLQTLDSSISPEDT